MECLFVRETGVDELDNSLPLKKIMVVLATIREARDRVVGWAFRDAIELLVSGNSPTEGWSFGVASVIIETLSNDDDDGSENITTKMSLGPFKLYRVYLELLDSLNVADVSWSWIF